MMNTPQDKQIGNDDFKKEEGTLHTKDVADTVENEYFFPLEQKVIKAASLDEAVEKLKKLMETN